MVGFPKSSHNYNCYFNTITVLVFSSKESVVVLVSCTVLLVDSLLRIKSQCVGYIQLAHKAFKHASGTLHNITLGFVVNPVILL